MEMMWVAHRRITPMYRLDADEAAGDVNEHVSSRYPLQVGASTK